MRKKRESSPDSEPVNNLIKTYKSVIDTFAGKVSKYESLLKDISFFESQVNGEKSPVNVNIIRECIRNITSNYEYYRERLKSYQDQIEPIIKKYQPLSQQPIIVSFEDKSQSENKAQHLIDAFNSITYQYTQIPVQKRIVSNKICSTCKSRSLKDYDNKILCLKCFKIIWKHISNSCVEDKDTGMSTTKYMYERPSFFKAWAKKFQGKHNPKIPETVYAKIFSLIDKYRIDIKTLTKTEMTLMLRDNDMSGYVEDINFFYYDILRKRTPQELWGTLPTPPDITPYESRLYAEYNMYDSIYDEVLRTAKEKFPTIDRENSTNSVYTLCKLLERQGYIMSTEDKNIFLKCDSKIIEHDYIWKIACQLLNWNFIETI